MLEGSILKQSGFGKNYLTKYSQSNFITFGILNRYCALSLSNK